MPSNLDRLMIMNRYSILLTIAILAAGCGMRSSTETNNSTASGANSKPAETVKNEPATPVSPAAEISGKGTVCGPVSMPGKVFVAKQSFPFDHAPFNGSCFVTFGSKEDMMDEKDLPRGSTFHIFKDGKKVYDFPDAFGGQSACWAEAVAFKDLNGDGKTDVIMAGKCLGAKDSYTTNAVYVNEITEFTTNDEANMMIEELKTVSQIEQYVKKHTKEFF